MKIHLTIKQWIEWILR